MGGDKRNKVSKSPWPRDFTERAREFFEPQLEDLGLGPKQIAAQSLDELLDSLERINDAMRNPELFGILRLKATVNMSVFVSTGGTESHIEVGALPLLLKRKKLINERIRELRGKREIEDLSDLIDSLADEDLRKRLLTELEALRKRPTVVDDDCAIRKDYAFIAMSMDPRDPQLDDILDAIKDGASNCGIAAERVDEEQTNEPITDRMLDSISEAEFVVVDLTQSRPNVYYEAGFAQGLGKTPVYVAKEGTPIHFDLKDYPVIFYPNMRTLRTSLADRLKAISAGRKLT